MCRSKECGGRRCSGGKGSYQARLDRQRRYQARRRAAAKLAGDGAAAAGGGGSGSAAWAALQSKVSASYDAATAAAAHSKADAVALQPEVLAYTAAVIDAGAQVASRVEARVPVIPVDASPEDQKVFLKARADAYREELASIRAFGGVEQHTTDSSVKKGVATAQEQVAHFPDDWVSLSNSVPPYRVLKIKGGSARAHYSGGRHQKAKAVSRPMSKGQAEQLLGGLDYTFDDEHPRKQSPMWKDDSDRVVPLVKDGPELKARLKNYNQSTWGGKIGTVASDKKGYVYVGLTRMESKEITAEITSAAGNSSTMLHELSHRMEEHNPSIALATKSFLHRRCEGKPFKKYHGSETYRDGEFANIYIGKNYSGTRHTEVLSMGMEATFHGKYGGLEGLDGCKADHEHRNLVLGLLAFARH